ncbi:Uncharacterised protein [Bordetella pertussis]|nr:Uncharacterised protein [Bordetella pertussis]
MSVSRRCRCQRRPASRTCSAVPRATWLSLLRSNRSSR